MFASGELVQVLTGVCPYPWFLLASGNRALEADDPPSDMSSQGQ